MNVVGPNGKVAISGQPDARLYANNLVANNRNEIIGVLMDEKTTLLTPEGKFLGRLFPDGQVYNEKGVAVGKINGDLASFYGRQLGAVVKKGLVADFKGNPIGLVNHDGQVINRFGEVLGHIDAKGSFIDAKGDYRGGVVSKGSAIGYDGSFLGYAVTDGAVISMEGAKVGQVTSDNKVVDLKIKSSAKSFLKISWLTSGAIIKGASTPWAMLST